MPQSQSPLLLAVLLLLALASPSLAFLADDFDGPHSKRIVVGGELLPTPVADGKAWDGQRGWHSLMRIDDAHPAFYGRKEFVLYRNLVPGRDLPLDSGTFEIWFQHRWERENPYDYDALVTFFDKTGFELAVIEVSYGDGHKPSSISTDRVAAVWGKELPIPAIAVGQWAHLALVWGPDPDRDNRAYLNGMRIDDPALLGRSNFAEVVAATRSVMIGAGWHQILDPAYHTVIDEFTFSGGLKSSFDLSRSAVGGVDTEQVR